MSENNFSKNALHSIEQSNSFNPGTDKNGLSADCHTKSSENVVVLPKSSCHNDMHEGRAAQVTSEVTSVSVSNTPTDGTGSQTNEFVSSSGTSGTVSSVETVPISSQEVDEEIVAEQRQSKWGVLLAMQPEFYHCELFKDCYTVGRDEQCDYRLDIPSIKKNKFYKHYSKLHFSISRTIDSDRLAPNVFVEDLGGTNGTFINGERIPSKSKRHIKEKDKIAMSYAWNNVFLYADCGKDSNLDLPPEFSNKYVMHHSIGRGAHGEVREIWQKVGVGRFACKIIKKVCLGLQSDQPSSVSRDIMTEVNILLQLKHPCIIRIHDFVDSPNTLYMILEYANGGELFQRLIEKGALPEPLAKLYFYQMLCAVDYLHEHGITHRDLKPENILLMSTAEPSLLKITDFGLSRLVGEQSFMKTLAGSPSYLAPEILQSARMGSYRGYTKLVDMWSLGVILYVCLAAYIPFSPERKDTDQAIEFQILTANYNFNTNQWKSISPLAKQLITHLLQLDYTKRLTTSKALSHPWLDDSQMLTKARQLMRPEIYSASVNLMEERSISAESISTSKASTDNDSNLSKQQSNEHVTENKEKHLKRSQMEDEQIVPSKQPKVA